MIHPETRIQHISELIGVGVFAKSFIPKGTITVVRDSQDLCIPVPEFRQLSQLVQDSMETHMYHDKIGNLVLSWDHAKYINHHCNSNTLMTDYNLEIAVADIYPGEEITTDYGLLNVQDPYELYCDCTNCRKALRRDDIDVFAEVWDSKILSSLLLTKSVPQPLFSLLPNEERMRLNELFQDKSKYSSVKSLKYRA
jgi:uncharacterized protein